MVLVVLAGRRSMTSKLKKNEILVFILYLIVTITMLVGSYVYFPQTSASDFDSFYTAALFKLIAMYGLLCFCDDFRVLLVQLIALGTFLSTTCIILFYNYASNDFYFLFENFSYSWIDISGIVMISLYIVLGSIMGICLWVIKRF